METALFYFFGGISLLSAVGVVAQKRVFYQAISLIVCLCSVSALYLLLQAPFIAAVQIIVYAGAVMVLFLFVIMLLDPFSAAIIRDKKKSLAYLAVLLGIVTFMLLFPLLGSFDPARSPRNVGFMRGSTDSVAHLGQILFNEYLLPFEATSVLILVAIIGAVVLAKRRL